MPDERYANSGDSNREAKGREDDRRCSFARDSSTVKCLGVAEDGEYRADEETVVITMVRTPDQQGQDEELTDAGKNQGTEEKHRSRRE